MTKRRIPGDGVLLGLVLFAFVRPHLARGQVITVQQTSQRTVVLPDGSVYSGEVVELVPGDHLTLRLATGEVRRFAWSDVQASISAGGGVQTGVTGAMPNWPGVLMGMGMSPGLEGQPDPVQVHFEATDSQATLFRGSLMMGLPTGISAATDLGLWSPVCHAPCDARVDRRMIFSVQGPRLVNSPSFTLPQRGSSMTIDADVGHQSTRIAAVLMDSLGIAAAITGGTMMILSASVNTSLDSFDPMGLQNQMDAQSRQHAYLVAGGATLGVGVALLAVGVTMHLLSRTTVGVRGFGRIAARPGGARLEPTALALRF